MKPLYIVGAGGAAKEIYLLVKEVNRSSELYKFRGFIDLDANNEFLEIGSEKLSILKESEFLDRKEEKVAVVFGLGDTDRLKKVVEIYQKNLFFEFPNLIHPSIRLDESIILGIGNIITTQCVFTVSTSVKSFNYINRGVHIGHNCIIGSYNVINPCTVISGGVIIENENLIGTNATVLQYLTIGSKNKIGAGAVVINNIDSKKMVAGVPAKIIKEL